jgi:putative endonuclease
VNVVPVHFGRLSNSQVFGNAQESKAARYLRFQGLKLLCRNYRSRHGEIDLIMTDSNTLVFGEVRYRRSEYFGGALNSVTSIKQKKIRLLAAHYLQAHPQPQCSCRFDVMGLTHTTITAIHAKEFRFDWIKNAFYSNFHLLLRVIFNTS